MDGALVPTRDHRLAAPSKNYRHSTNLQEGTGETYRRTLDRHVLPALGAVRLRELTTPRVDAFLQTVKRTVGSPTARTCRSIVSGVMGFAVRQGAIAVNPVREADKLPQKRSTPRALTESERSRWLSRLWADRVAVAKDLPDLTAFMLGTGVRIGEALASASARRWRSRGTRSTLRRAAWRSRGSSCGSPARACSAFRAPRATRGERLLPLPAFVAELLTRRRRLAELDGPIEPGSAVPVFPHTFGGWRDPRNTRRDLRDARGSAEFAWVTSHVFRKTCATILDEAGLSARVIADQLGHARPSMTQDVYMGRKSVTPSTAAALDRAFRVGTTNSGG